MMAARATEFPGGEGWDESAATMLENLGAIIWVIGCGAWLLAIVKILWLLILIPALASIVLLVRWMRQARR